jgi:hypothetical protein
MLTVTYADAVAPRQDKNSTTVAENNFEGILTKILQISLNKKFLNQSVKMTFLLLSRGRFFGPPDMACVILPCPGTPY